jgi:hypothetical protein
MSAFVQGKGAFTGNGGTASLAYTSSVTKGDLLVVLAQIHGATGGYNPGTPSISDSVGTTWIPFQAVFQITAGNWAAGWYGFAPSTGANTVSVTMAATNLSGHGLNITEFSGVNAFDQYAVSSVYSGASPKAMASPTITPGAANGVAIACSFGVGAAPTSFVGTNSYTDNFGYWQTAMFIDQNWKTFSTAAAQSTTVTATFTGSITAAYVGLVTFVLSSPRQRSMVGVGL